MREIKLNILMKLLFPISILCGIIGFPTINIISNSLIQGLFFGIAVGLLFFLWLYTLYYLYYNNIK